MIAATTLLWLRRDLRVHDNRAIARAAITGRPVIAAFIFDDIILNALEPDDRRITFICQALSELQQNLARLGIPLIHEKGDPTALIPALAEKYNAQEIVASEDYEPSAVYRDRLTAQTLAQAGRQLTLMTDQVVFAKDAILTKQGAPYSVFTPYKRAWLEKYRAAPPLLETLNYRQPLPFAPQPIPTPAALGFQEFHDQPQGGEAAALAHLEDFLPKLADYHEARDFPAQSGTSNLAPYLRFGCLSIRQLASLAASAGNAGADTWLSELIWREFYQQHLWHNPDNVTQSFKPQYREIDWPNNPAWLAAWQNGTTGYPIVDAAMRCLKATGTMHNRLRMITASFLCKDLLCDWRLGEAWFARYLLDFDLAANNGGWQWAAGTGCDAQPYFRIFNPLAQSQKFDPGGRFIRQWLPELAHFDNKSIHAPPQDLFAGNYPAPIVNHAQQRERALSLYKNAASAYQHFAE